MQQRRSCKSETESALSARQSVVRRWYSSWIRFLCSRWEAHGHFIRHWSGPHATLSFRPKSFARWSLIHGSTRLCMNSITALTNSLEEQTQQRVALCGVGGNYQNQMETLTRYAKLYYYWLK